MKPIKDIINGGIELKQRDERTHDKQRFTTFSRSMPLKLQATTGLKGGRVKAFVRFDDDPKNNHDTFSITGEVYCPGDRRDEPSSCGCIHDIISVVFPELEPFIKWHLTSTDEPMHYLSTIYLAGERDCWGLLKGEPSKKPCHQKPLIYFGTSAVGIPIHPEIMQFFEQQIKQGHPIKDLVPEPVEHVNRPGTNYKFGPKWTFKGMPSDWYKCPFDNERQATEWAAGLADHWRVLYMPTWFGEGKARELDRARHCAVWPDATDEQLCLPADQLKQLLIDRFPALMQDFKRDMESLGFTYLPPLATVPK